MTTITRREFLDRSKQIGIGLAAGATVAGWPEDAMSFAESGKLKAGAAARVVNPTKPMAIVGHRNMRLFSNIYADLRVQALALEDRTGKRVIWLGFDFCKIHSKLVDRLKKLIHQQYGIEPSAVCINASHTHSAPPLTPFEAAKAEHVDPEYTEFVVREAMAVVGETLERLAPARVRYVEDNCNTVAINRRLGEPGHVRLAPNPNGVVDHRVQVVAAEAESDGKLIGVAVRYACHPSTVTNGVGSGFPGFMCRFVEKSHPGAVAMFLQGCCGDVRNRSVNKDVTRFVPGTVEQCRGFGRDLADAVDRALKKSGIPIAGPVEANYSEIDLPVEKLPAEVYAKAAAGGNIFTAAWGKMYTGMLQRGEKIPETAPYRIQTFRFGDGNAPFTLVALDGEDFTEYGFNLERMLRPGTTIVLGYSNGVISYVPTAKALREGGYETWAYKWFRLPGPYTCEVEPMILHAAAKLARPKPN